MTSDSNIGENTVVRSRPHYVNGLDTAELSGTQIINEAGDLPDPNDAGEIVLQDETAYQLNDFVMTPHPVVLGTRTPLIGTHGSMAGLINTDGGTALKGTDAGLFLRSMYLHSPGGTIFDLSADQSTEMLCESVSMSDAAGLGSISDLGTIDGFRAPSFKGCNFEDFDAGLTFDGDADKLFFSNSPMRTVTASNVTIFTLKGSANIQIVDFANNYVKDVQSDTEVWRVESGGEPSEVFQYRGTTHDTSVTKSNVLTGPNASTKVEPFWVSDSYPIRDSGVTGEMHNDGEASVTINSQDTFTKVDIASTIDQKERVEKVADGVMEYVGAKDVNGKVHVNLSFYGANGDIYVFGLEKNGTVDTAHQQSVEAAGQNANVTVPVNAIQELATNDQVALVVKNESATNDPTISSYTFGIRARS
jgi:hypothetical protein